MKKYFFFILSILFFNCTNKQNKIVRYTEEQITALGLDSSIILTVETDSVIKIDLNPFLKTQNYELGSLVEEVKIIPLETTNESLLDAIYKILVTDSNIYIYDKFKGGGIVVFNKDGKFIKRISNGPGPGELRRLYDISYDSERNELVAFQHSFFLFFGPSGEFIRQERPPFVFYNFSIIPNGYVFKALDKQGNGHLGILEYYTFFVTDKNYKLKSVALPVLPNNINFGGYNYLYENNHAIMVTERFSDTIYQYILETDRLKAIYIIDYSKKKLPDYYLQGSHEEFENSIIQNDYYYYLGEYIETNSHHAFVLMNDHSGLRTIIYRDKQSGNLKGGNYGICEGIYGMPSMSLPRAASGNWFISLHTPDKNDDFLSNTNTSIVSNTEKQKILNLLEDDNPVLVFYRLKNF